MRRRRKTYILELESEERRNEWGDFPIKKQSASFAKICTGKYTRSNKVYIRRDNMKIMRKRVTVLLIVLFVFILFFLTYENKFERLNTESDNPMDMSIEQEKEQHKDVINRFLNDDEALQSVSDNLNQVAGDFIPEGSICTDVEVIGKVVYIDYRLQDVRYLVAYYEDGTVEKVARERNSDDIYSIDSKSNTIEHMNADDNRIFGT